MPPRILLIHTGGGVGDVLLSSPIAAAFKRRWPDAHVTAWVRPEIWPLFDGHPDVDAPLRIAGRHAAAALRAVRAGRFDVAVLPWTTGAQASMAWLARVPVRVGQRGRAAYSWMFSHPVDVASTHGDSTSHWLQIQLGYARALDCPTDGLAPHIALRPGERQAARDFLDRRGVVAGRPVCGLHIGKGLPLTLERWPIGRFVETGRAMRRAGYEVVLTGSGAERDVVNSVAQGIGRGATALAGETDVRQLAGVIACMSVLVCPDSGPCHIAAAIGVPVVSLFALKSDVIARWRPWTPRHRVVTPMPGWTCRRRRCVKERCARFDCLEALDARAIARAALELASQGAPEGLPG